MFTFRKLSEFKIILRVDLLKNREFTLGVGGVEIGR